MLTVLIASRNGAETLPTVLTSYCAVQAPIGGWKLVVVDNGSSDSSKEIILSFKDRLPLTYLFEPCQGKNKALNIALPSVQGDLVLFADDDILPRPDWLIEMRRGADLHPEFSVFGGPIVPHWEVPPEPWILEWVQIIPVFSMTDPAWQEGPLAPGYIFGGNMALRSTVFESGYRFNVAIGPRGRSYAMGSETELTLRLAKAGFGSWHCKQAVVEHIVRKSQMQRSWILSRSTRLGRSKYRLWIQHENVYRRKYLGVPGYLIRELVKRGADVGRAKLFGTPEEFFKMQWIFNFLLGQAVEARVIHNDLYLNRSNSAAQPHL